MRLLYFDGNSRCQRDTEGNIYTSSNLEGSIIRRYRRYCDELSLLLIEDEKIYSVSEARAKLNVLDAGIAEITAVPNLHRPRKNFFNLALRKKAVETIAAEINRADRVIVRAPGRFNTNTALKFCRKYGKTYLIESVDFAFEFTWQNKLTRLFAPYVEFMCRREIARAPYVVYVTQNALQGRYPSAGRTLGCSDVELPDSDASLRSTTHVCGGHDDNSRVIFGTAAGIGRFKGQEYVVQAIAELRKQGITNIEYRLAGTNINHYLDSLIASLNLQDTVKLYETVPHDKIFDWYDQLDAYIQPSMTEALGRSVIEAMSRGLPAACSRVGGMVEYANQELMFEAGNVGEICEVMKKLLDPAVRRRESEYSIAKAKEFAKSRLDPIRTKFYTDFMNGR